MTMTPEQAKQFPDFGCGIRCLSELSKDRPEFKSDEFIIETFAIDYTDTGDESDWRNRCGVMTIPMAIKMATGLGLCNSVDTSLSDRHLSVQDARQWLKSHHYGALLVLTLNEPHHWMLFRDFYEGGWIFFDPLSDGTAPDSPFSDIELALRAPYFLVLQP